MDRSAARSRGVKGVAVCAQARCQSTGPGGQQVAAERAAEHLLRPARAAEQALEVDAGLDPHLVQHRDQVLAGDVAGRARAAPGSRRARRTSSRTSRLPPRARRARWRGPGRGCCGSARSARRRRARSRACSKNDAHLDRVRHAGRVAEGDLLATRRREPARDAENALLGHLALVGAAERDRDHALAAKALARERARSRARGPASDSSIERLTFLRLCVSLADRNRLTSSNSRSPASSRQRKPALEALLVRDQDRVGDVRVALDRAQHLALRRRAAGSRRAARSEVTSSRRRPVRDRQSISRTLSAVSMTSGSFWKPSRGPTSRMRTALRNAPAIGQAH